jgi:hypothetical protein
MDAIFIVIAPPFAVTVVCFGTLVGHRWAPTVQQPQPLASTCRLSNRWTLR